MRVFHHAAYIGPNSQRLHAVNNKAMVLLGGAEKPTGVCKRLHKRQA